jgi:ABC-type dipeptide/oligopeptide/nickel transport system permease component
MQTSSGWLVIPALILGPLSLWLGFAVFHKNLIFPIYLFSSWEDLILYTLVPATILSVGSGLVSQIATLTRYEIQYWRSKPCYLAAIAYGKPVKLSFFKIVAVQSLATAWQRSLPWLLGELIILEIIFNIPGLGFEAWRYAKTRDLGMLGINLGAIVAIYVVCTFALLRVNRWIGKRLTSYV